MLPEFANGKNNYICWGVSGWRGLGAKVPSTIVVIALVVVVGA